MAGELLQIMANYHSLWVRLCLLYLICTLHAVSLQIALLVRSTLATVGDDG